jgi:hypothetical protein
MYLKLESVHSSVLERHHESIETNSLLKSSIVSLERAVADARRMVPCQASEDTASGELQRENMALREEIQSQARQLRDIYTGRLQHHSANHRRASQADARAARAIAQEQAAATQHHAQLKLALQEARQQLSQERCLRVRAEGELKSAEYLEARPDWSRPARADRLGQGLTTEASEREHARGGNP